MPKPSPEDVELRQRLEGLARMAEDGELPKVNDLTLLVRASEEILMKALADPQTPNREKLALDIVKAFTPKPKGGAVAHPQTESPLEGLPKEVVDEVLSE